MKRTGYLFDQITDKENIRLAHHKARKGKSHYREVKFVNANMEQCIDDIHNSLKNQTFRCADYEIFTKQCGPKIREIYKLPYYPDRIVHHAIMDVLEPVWNRVLIRDTFSSIPGRGIHDGVRRVQKSLKNVEETMYCLKFDIHKYYPSVNHEKLKIIIRKTIKDAKVISLLDEIIDKEKGLPIGNLLSQYFGNLYLAYFDHYCKEHLNSKHYFRYCDDVVVLASDKKYLHHFFKEAKAYLTGELNLTIKPNYQIFTVDSRGIDFLGYRFFHGYTLLRKSIKKKMIKAVASGNQKAFPSYHGWMKHANCYNLQNKYLNESTIRTTAASN